MSMSSLVNTIANRLSPKQQAAQLASDLKVTGSPQYMAAVEVNQLLADLSTRIGKADPRKASSAFEKATASVKLKGATTRATMKLVRRYEIDGKFHVRVQVDGKTYAGIENLQILANKFYRVDNFEQAVAQCLKAALR